MIQKLRGLDSRINVSSGPCLTPAIYVIFGERSENHQVLNSALLRGSDDMAWLSEVSYQEGMLLLLAAMFALTHDANIRLGLGGKRPLTRPHIAGRHEPPYL